MTPLAPRRSMKSAMASTERVAQDQRLERGVEQAEAECPPTDPTYRSARHLDQRRLAVPHSQLGMYRTLSQSHRRDRRLGDAGDFVLGFLPKPRRRHIDGLLEVGAVRMIRFVEDRQDLELAAPQHALHSHLGTGNETLEQNPTASLTRFHRDRQHLLGSGVQFLFGLHLHDSAAARKR